MQNHFISTRRREDYHAHVLPSHLFHYTGRLKLFTADISTIEHSMFPSAASNPLCQLYNDAIDQGFLMQSGLTGDIVPFVLASTDEQEGDVVGWHFVPDGYALKKRPSLQGVRVLIANT